MTQRRLRDGQVVNFSYDNLNREIARDLPNTEWQVHDKSFVYDLMGRKLVSTMSNGWTNWYSYDALGRQVQENAPLGNISRTFDAAGRMTSMTYPGDGLVVNYDYDMTGNITAIRENGATSGVGVLATYAYDNLGRRTSLTRGNGTVTNYAFDEIDRLSLLSHDVAGTANDVTTTLSYNPASQISIYTRDNDSYSWLAHYNVNRPYGTNGLNQLTTAGATALSYDGRGNLTSSGAVTYSYGPENLLATSVSAGGSTTMAYDSLGRLALVIGPAGTSAAVRFDYSGDELISERDWNGALLRRYVHGPADDDPLVWYEGAGTTDRRWLHADERGSIVGLSNSAGTMFAINSYDEYGIPAATNIGRFQYTGQTWLPEIGLYYYKARIYSPTLGRFMQTDPIGYADGINWYDYVDGDPVNRSDPTGLSGCGSRISGQNNCSGMSGLSFQKSLERAGAAVGAVMGGIIGRGAGGTGGAAAGLLCGPVAPGCVAAGGAVGQGLGAIGGRIVGEAIGSAVGGLLGAALDNGIVLFNKATGDASTPTGSRGSPIGVKSGTNTPTRVGGREYSGHSLDRMQGRGVTPSVVENAIRNGVKSAANAPGTFVHVGDRVTVITNSAGRVITVITK